MAMTPSRFSGCLLFAVIASSSPGSAEVATVVGPLVSTQEPIVNGLPTSEFPSTVLIILDGGACTGTLIGCSTVLTAAHCVCSTTGGSCGVGGPDLASAASLTVFGQHLGFVDVTSIQVQPSYELGVTGDVALLELSRSVAGIQPTAINTTVSPSHSTLGQIVGFGRVEGIFNTGSGIKRQGLVSTSSCNFGPEPDHICWEFLDPVGLPGLDSSICQGDSGGPLFVDFGAGPLVAGVASAVLPGCLTPNNPLEANVFFERNWVLNHALSPLGQPSCGGLPSAGGPGTIVPSAHDTLSPGNLEDTYSVEVPGSTVLMRITLNGEDVDPNLGVLNDFDLNVNFGSPPSGGLGDVCTSFNSGTYEACEIHSPATGTWYLQAENFNGFLGEYQLTVTLFEETQGCMPDSNTACLLDGKFKVEGQMSTFDNPPEVVPTRVMNFPGGRAESSQAVFFESFNVGNFEAGVKMVDGCGLPDGHPLQSYWAFFGALTNADTQLSIQDMVTLQTYEWTNPPGTFPQTVGDTNAFPCVDESQNALCIPDAETACLLDGRFRVTGVMKDFSDPPEVFPARVMNFPGSGRAESNQAVFWESFSSGNFEAGVKMVDGCGFPPGHPLRAYWAFYGALTNAETLIQITQLSSGLVDVWYNPPGAFPFSEGWTNAFPCE